MVKELCITVARQSVARLRRFPLRQGLEHCRMESHRLILERRAIVLCLLPMHGDLPMVAAMEDRKMGNYRRSSSIVHFPRQILLMAHHLRVDRMPLIRATCLVRRPCKYGAKKKDFKELHRL